MFIKYIAATFCLMYSFLVFPFPPNQSCMFDVEKQNIRSEELTNIAKQDQEDRENWESKNEEDLQKLEVNDLVRRKRVAEIFAEGCLSTSSDYLVAALIFQHGDFPDHYYQAFIWSRKAAELGDKNGKFFSALAIDRYLVSIGKKQLFGSQFYKAFGDECYCMQPVETTFPDNFRKDYSGRSLNDNYERMSSFNTSDCPNVECAQMLDDVPPGSIIGFW